MTARATTARPARFFLGAGSTALALALGGVPLLLAGTAHATQSSDAKISICHATDDDKGPYVTPPPASPAKILSGHGDHLGPVYAPGMKDDHIVWGDIIPSFDYVDGDGVTQHYDGLNWTTEGQAIYNNGCALPEAGGTTGGTDGGTDGGSTDGGSTDGGSTDGGSTDGGSTDGGSTDGGSTDGGSTDGGSTDGGSTDGGSTDGGSTDGGSTDGGSTDGGSTDGGSTDGGATGGTDTTGGFTGGGDGEVVTDPVPVKTITGGGGAVTTAHDLPFTGDRTSTLALWGFASLLGGVGFSFLGKREGKATR